MATYGRGQTLGSGINPESFKQDYSGFARAAEIQAQGLANLGGQIAGSIEKYGEMKKEQKKVDAYNKASAKSIEAAITLGDSYGIKGARETLSPFLSAVNDPSLSPIEKAALLDEGKAMIPNVFGRFDKSQALAIEQGQINAARMPKVQPLTLEPVLQKIGDGYLSYKKGSDGNNYDEIGNVITDMSAYAAGEPLEVYSAGRGSVAPNVIDTGLNMPTFGPVGDAPVIYNANDEPMLLPPPVGTFETPNVPIPLDPAAVEYAARLNTGQATPAGVGRVPMAAPPVGEPPASIALPPAIKSRIIPSGETSAVETFRPATKEESALYGGVPGQMSSKGRFYPINLPSGMTIESDGKGGFKVVQGTGVGAGTKTEGVAKAQQQMKDESLRLIQANTEEARSLLDEVGTNNPIAAAGNAVLAKVLPASQVGEMQKFFERINGENSFQKMNQLRASSPTGGAAGTMTEKEWPRFEGRFSPLDANARKDTLAKSLSLNALNAFEAANGTPQDVMKLLEDKKIDQATYDDYVNKYMKNREIARVGASGIAGASYDWTKLNKDLLKKSTIFEEPSATSSGSEEIYKKYLGQ